MGRYQWTRTRASHLAILAGLGLLASGGAAAAQDQATNTVDDIIVTAQKREQNLQDVPVVVTALSEELLQDAGVRDIKELTILTPGLTVTSTSNEAITTARIRGVGTVGDNPGLESSVLVTIDGVYRPRNGVGFGDLGNLQRIEVLKGPQGTLFGKNASAGVLNILTETPSFDFGAEGELTAGNYGQMGASVYVTGPVMEDVLAGSIYFATRQRDGFLDVTTGPGPRTLNEDVDQNFWTGRGQLLWQPTDTFSGRFIADYSKRDEDEDEDNKENQERKAREEAEREKLRQERENQVLTFRDKMEGDFNNLVRQLERDSQDYEIIKVNGADFRA